MEIAGQAPPRPESDHGLILLPLNNDIQNQQQELSKEILSEKGFVSMDSIGMTTEWIDDIFMHTKWQKMSKGVDVYTLDAYRKSCLEYGLTDHIDVVLEPSHGYGTGFDDVQEPENKIMYINKHFDLENPTSSFTRTPKTGYVIVGGPEYVWYLDFYLNSFYGKNLLATDDVEPGKTCSTTLKKLKSIEIACNKDVEPSCVFLQKVDRSLEDSLVWDVMDDLVRGAIKGCFMDIRDLIVFEMAIPKIFEEYDVAIVKNWMRVVDKVSS